ncbi:TIGR04282 family arsenosugar biosynthesis glycosyltransferase [Erythrobacteraceae bacterium WH01K]|nr:TIGR04282 family arsenosugar biosynthesis glycosyltransferase [Erythrobacteraceae bacterium WH01K]
MSAPVVSIFARWPTPGAAKTRLIPGYGEDGAAAIYTRLLEHTVREVRGSGLPFTLRTTGSEGPAFREWLGEEVSVTDQGDGDLTDRLCRVPAPGICIGSDCPGLTAGLLQDAASALESAPVVIGPASDGGYWLIGFSHPSPWLFADMPWSTDAVLPTTLERCAARGIEPVLLPQLSDVDEPEDLTDWPEFLP